MTGKVLKDQISILAVEKFGELTVASTTCNDFNAYLDLPDAIEVEGKVLGKTGWNSDRSVAYFRSDAKLGTAWRMK
jgi:hypothetical protein